MIDLVDIFFKTFALPQYVLNVIIVNNCICTLICLIPCDNICLFITVVNLHILCLSIYSDLFLSYFGILFVLPFLFLFFSFLVFFWVNSMFSLFFFGKRIHFTYSYYHFETYTPFFVFYDYF